MTRIVGLAAGWLGETPPRAVGWVSLRRDAAPAMSGTATTPAISKNEVAIESRRRLADSKREEAMIVMTGTGGPAGPPRFGQNRVERLEERDAFNGRVWQEPAVF